MLETTTNDAGEEPRFAAPHWLALFVLAHVVLALAMRAIPLFATLHALATVALCVLVAATTRHSRNILFAVAYLAGTEVLWRITHAGVFYEFGKYAVVLVVAIALMRHRGRRNALLIFGYFALLVPSALLTITALGFDDARQQISFNWSGPLSLACCVAFFSNVRLRLSDLKLTGFAILAPAIGIATLTYTSTAAFREIQFNIDSMFVTSGGFGPNQVSAILGLGVLFGLLLLMDRKQHLALRIVLFVAVPALAVEAALTFSRGGLVLALASAFAALFYLVRERQTRVTLFLLAALLVGLGKYVVVPKLEVFTQGRLSERYTSLDSSGRTQLAVSDLAIFADAPLIGVGPGMGPALRLKRGHLGAAHTEFTRLLAEHGLLGATSLLILIFVGGRTLKRARTTRARAYVLAMLVWVTLFLAINAMRVVAPSFLFGLACSISFSSLPRPAKPSHPLEPTVS